MLAWARSASSARILISLSHIFKRISCGSPGITGTCGIGDVYERLQFRFGKLIRCELFG